MTTAPFEPPLNEQFLNRLLHQRIVVLDGELDDRIGTRLCAQMFLLAADDPHSDISLWINSPGGSVAAMLAIMDTMRLVPNDVSTLALGIACSAGQFLLSAGTRGKRFALPHTRVLMHQGSAGIGGTAVDIEMQADELRNTRDTVLELIAEHTGQPIDVITRDSQRDRWYSATEAREYGFVDEVVTSLDVV
ncbi:MAG TPA: ATP-dependent Clp protease proteolytic subunit, partial [Kribbellaceae bacterium]|nr:ATP-dependent Clp protease proteolytic subunit [Kribbellaceae bacterium]